MAHPQKLSILSINNSQGGFAERKLVDAGTTVDQFVRSLGINVVEHTIRVNQSEVAADYLLEDNQTVTITPLKIKGA